MTHATEPPRPWTHICSKDERGDWLDHPTLVAFCSNPECSDNPPELRECSISDCVCWASNMGTCAHCDAPAEVEPDPGPRVWNADDFPEGSVKAPHRRKDCPGFDGTYWCEIHAEATP